MGIDGRVCREGQESKHPEEELCLRDDAREHLAARVTLTLGTDIGVEETHDDKETDDSVEVGPLLHTHHLEDHEEAHVEVLQDGAEDNPEHAGDGHDNPDEQVHNHHGDGNGQVQCGQCEPAKMMNEMNEIFLYILYFIFCLTHLAASHKFGCLSASQKTPDILIFYSILFYLMYRSSLIKHKLVKICPKEKKKFLEASQHNY